MLVHDAARPLVSPGLVGAVLDAVEGADGAIAAASMVSILMAVSVVVLLEKVIGLKAYVKL